MKSSLQKIIKSVLCLSSSSL